MRIKRFTGSSNKTVQFEIKTWFRVWNSNEKNKILIYYLILEATTFKLSVSNAHTSVPIPSPFSVIPKPLAPHFFLQNTYSENPPGPAHISAK